MENNKTQTLFMGFDTSKGILTTAVTENMWYTTDDIAAEMVVMLLNKIDGGRWVSKNFKGLKGFYYLIKE